MLTWIIDKHVDRVRNAPTPFIEEATSRGHKVYGLRDSIIPKAIDLSGITITGPTIVRGSHGFVGYVERELNPLPGGFLHPENFKLSVYAPAIGDFALNSQFAIMTYSEFGRSRFDADIFVKPLQEMKKFTGIVLNKGETLSEKHATVHGKWFEPDSQCELIVSPYKPISEEHRIVVVNGVPITGSHFDVQDTRPTPEHVMETVTEIASVWNPISVYVVDIAETPEGNKVVEYNQFSTSAMYNCDQKKIVDALENIFL